MVEALLAVSFVRTLVLALVAAGLGAWIFLVELPASREEAKGDPLVDFEIEDVASLRLAYPNGSSIAVQREGDQWMLTEPVAYLADGNVVENFLTTIKDTQIERRISKDESGALSTYGLEGDRGSQARLELTRKDGSALPVVVLGGTTPVDNLAFARREGEDQVFVIPLLLQSSAKKNPDELRSKPMFQTDGSSVSHVTIAKPDETIKLERRGESTWAMLAPVVDAADNESVRSMLDSLATIDAVAFYDGDQADRAAFGLDTEGTKFTATQDGGDEISFTIGKDATDAPAGNYFERGSDKQVIKAPDWVAKKFAPAANDLRERRLLSCRVDEILSMTWSRAGESFTISREAAGKPWSISPELPDQVLNQRIVDNAVNGLALARADAVIADATDEAGLATWGLTTPVAKLDVQGVNGSCGRLIGSPAVDAAAPDGSPAQAPVAVRNYYVKSADRSAILRASEHEFSRLAMKRPEFVDATPKAATNSN